MRFDDEKIAERKDFLAIPKKSSFFVSSKKAQKMKIVQNRVVSLVYDLEVEDEIIQSVKKEHPMEFIFGTGYLLPKFEEQILHKEAGDRYDFTLSAADSYGDDNPQAYIEISKEIFDVDGKKEPGFFAEGRILPMQDSEGNRINGSIEEVHEETIVMNFNHPLAGCELHFSGSILSVREATPQELADGLFPNQEGCASSDCSSCSGCK